MKKLLYILLTASVFIAVFVSQSYSKTATIIVKADRGVLEFAEFGMSKKEILKKCNHLLYEESAFDYHGEVYNNVYGDAHFDKYDKLQSIDFDFQNIINKCRVGLIVKIGSETISGRTTKRDLLPCKDIGLMKINDNYYMDRQRKMLFVFDESDILRGFSVYRDRLD